MRNHSDPTAKRTLLCLFTFLSLQGCGAPDQSHDSPVALATAQQNTPNASKAENAQLRASFEDIAPEGWSLRRFSEGVASYIVSIPQAPPATKMDIVSGAITLDGRNEAMVKFRRAVPRYTDDTEQEIRAASNLYPDFDGYRKTVSAGSSGYHLKSGKDIHAVAYKNIEKAISCYGRSPGQFACYWGSPDKRMSLYFNSNDLGIVLPYVLRMAEGRAPTAL